MTEQSTRGSSHLMVQNNVTHILSIIDGSTEEVDEVVHLPSFNLPDFARQFDVDLKQDPQMLDRYAVGPDDLSFLKRHLTQKIEFNFQHYAYFIEAVTVA